MTSAVGAPSIRSARVGDASAIAAFQAEQWRTAYRDLIPERTDDPAADERERRWRWHLGAGSRGVALAESAGSIVGVASWTSGPPHDGTTPAAEPAPPGPELPELELKSLYVDARFQGTGLAAALMESGLHGAPATLWVYEENLRARSFYRKHGFITTLRRKIDPGTALWELRLLRPASPG